MSRLSSALLLTIPALAFAAEPARDQAEASGHPPKREETRHRPEAALFVVKLLEMDDEKLARMRTAIERVEKMPTTERAALRSRIRAAREASPEDRERLMKELHEKFGDLTLGPPPGRPGEKSRGDSTSRREDSGKPSHAAAHRDLLEKHFSSMPPETAKAEKEKFLALPREEKVAFLKKLRRDLGLPDKNDAPPPPAAAPDKNDPLRPAGT